MNKFINSPDAELLRLFKVNQERIKDKINLLKDSVCLDLELDIHYHKENLQDIEQEMIKRGLLINLY